MLFCGGLKRPSSLAWWALVVCAYEMRNVPNKGLRRQTAASSAKAVTWLGILLILASGLSFSIMSLSVRSLRDTFRPDSLVFFRSTFQALILVPWLSEFVHAFKEPRTLRSHFLRGTFGIASMWCLYVSLQLLPVAFATLLAMTSVVWATLASWIFLKERVSNPRIKACVITVIGILTVAIPTREVSSWHFHAVGVAAGLLCGVFMGGALTVLRHMRQGMRTEEIVFFFGVTGVLLMLPSFAAHPQWPGTVTEWKWLVAAAVAATGGQLLMTAGYRYTPTAIASLLNLFQVLFNIALGFWVLGETPPARFFVGGTIVLVGFVALVSARSEAHRESPQVC